jgi:glycerate kinase
MRLRVLIAPDKFKGTLTAGGAAEAMALGWHEGRPSDRLELLPISDGGDGFGEVMSDLMGAVPQTVQTCDAAHRPCKARWWWESRSKSAVIETAEVVGLAKLPANRFHPFALDTYGLGKVVHAAVELGAKRCLVGLGGSATNDGGFGLARALGWEFTNDRGEAIERWTELPTAIQLARPLPHRLFPELVAAVDVQNPLLGPRGATRIYGPQKGLKPADFGAAERCLARLVALVQKTKGRDVATEPGAGAAGGLGFGFAAFLGGRLESGFQLVSREADLERRLRRADLVITGEGAIDGSTFMGKGAGCVARLCHERGIGCIGLAGAIGSGIGRKRLFTRMHSMTEMTTEAEAKGKPAKWLRTLAKQVAQQLP